MTQFQSVEEVVAALRRRAPLILLVTILGCIASVIFALSRPDVYVATAVVQIEDAQVEEAPADFSAPRTAPGRRVQLIEQRMMARDNLVAIMDEYELFTDDPELPLTERVALMRRAAQVSQIRGGAQPWQTDVAPSGITITVRLEDPEKAAAVANDLMASVIDRSRAQTRARIDSALGFFDAEVSRLAAQIEATEAQIAAFKRENTDALPEAVAPLRDQRATLEENRLALEQEVISLRSASERQREEVQAAQVALLTDQIAVVDGRIREIVDALGRAPAVEQQLAAQERALSVLNERFQSATRRRADAEMQALLDNQQISDRMEVLERALPPEVPVSTSGTKLAVAGGIASVMLALGVAFLAELMNPAIRNAAQLERALGLKPVVTIPVVATRGDRARRRAMRLVAGVLGLAAVAALVSGLGARLLGAEVWKRLMPGTLFD